MQYWKIVGSICFAIVFGSILCYMFLFVDEDDIKNKDEARGSEIYKAELPEKNKNVSAMNDSSEQSNHTSESYWIPFNKTRSSPTDNRASAAYYKVLVATLLSFSTVSLILAARMIIKPFHEKWQTKSKKFNSKPNEADEYTILFAEDSGVCMDKSGKRIEEIYINNNCQQLSDYAQYLLENEMYSSSSSSSTSVSSETKPALSEYGKMLVRRSASQTSV